MSTLCRPPHLLCPVRDRWRDRLGSSISTDNEDTTATGGVAASGSIRAGFTGVVAAPTRSDDEDCSESEDDHAGGAYGGGRGRRRGGRKEVAEDHVDPNSIRMNPHLVKFAEVVRKLDRTERDDPCPICQDKLGAESSYQDDHMDSKCVVRFVCGHMLHHNCAASMIKTQDDKNYFKCVSCNMVVGTRRGDQPEGGEMRIKLEGTAKNSRPWHPGGGEPKPSWTLPGFPDSLGVIVIDYRFQHGVQGPQHPNPGQPYFAQGFPRTAYLPFDVDGYEVLCMLKIAFDRRLIFTIGTSATTGMNNALTWSTIHHKTQSTGGEHGYPDPNYLSNVKKELAAVGVTPRDIPDDPAVNLGIGFEF